MANAKNDEPNNSYLQCRHCQRERHTNFGYALRNGWPECCGATMMLMSYTADIDEEVRRAIHEQL